MKIINYFLMFFLLLVFSQSSIAKNIIEKDNAIRVASKSVFITEFVTKKFILQTSVQQADISKTTLSYCDSIKLDVNPENNIIMIFSEMFGELNLNISFIDLLGYVYSQTNLKVNYGKNTLLHDFSQYKNGIYLLSINDNNNFICTSKFLIK